MQVNRLAALYGAVLLAVGGLLGGQYLLLSHFESRRTAGEEAARTAGDRADAPESLSDAQTDHRSSEPGRSPSDSHDGLDVVDAPARLSVPNDAAPIGADGVDEPGGVGAIIVSELPDATTEQRKVWAEVFEDLPPHAVRELLRLRESVGRPGPSD